MTFTLPFRFPPPLPPDFPISFGTHTYALAGLPAFVLRRTVDFFPCSSSGRGDFTRGDLLIFFGVLLFPTLLPHTHLFLGLCSVGCKWKWGPFVGKLDDLGMFGTHSSIACQGVQPFFEHPGMIWWGICL